MEFRSQATPTLILTASIFALTMLMLTLTALEFAAFVSIFTENLPD